MSADVSGVDWPLVLGSFSAVVLFLFSVALVAVVARRKGISYESLLPHWHTVLIVFTCEMFNFLSFFSCDPSLKVKAAAEEKKKRYCLLSAY